MMVSRAHICLRRDEIRLSIIPVKFHKFENSRQGFKLDEGTSPEGRGRERYPFPERIYEVDKLKKSKSLVDVNPCLSRLFPLSRQSSTTKWTNTQLTTAWSIASIAVDREYAVGRR